MLALVFVTTVLIGFIPGATAAWALTLVSGLALAAYVALLVRMRQMAEERERKLHYLRPDAGYHRFDDGRDGYPGPGGDLPTVSRTCRCGSADATPTPPTRPPWPTDPPENAPGLRWVGCGMTSSSLHSDSTSDDTGRLAPVTPRPITRCPTPWTPPWPDGSCSAIPSTCAGRPAS